MLFAVFQNAVAVCCSISRCHAQARRAQDPQLIPAQIPARFISQHIQVLFDCLKFCSVKQNRSSRSTSKFFKDRLRLFRISIYFQNVKPRVAPRFFAPFSRFSAQRRISPGQILRALFAPFLSQRKALLLKCVLCPSVYTSCCVPSASAPPDEYFPG